MFTFSNVSIADLSITVTNASAIGLRDILYPISLVRSDSYLPPGPAHRCWPGPLSIAS